jgi:Zn-dependent peptidase ImmA (M78 family)/transcriptional regulator with XRE-family HTH domain
VTTTAQSRSAHPLVRLKEAREARGWSLDELASRLGAHRQLVHRYERGEIQATPVTIARFAEALRVPVSFFSSPTPVAEPAPVFYRQFRSKTPPKHLLAVDRQLAWLSTFLRSIEEHVILPPVNVPDFHPPSDPRILLNSKIEESASALRRYWGMGEGVIRDVMRLVENHGCIVVAELVQSATIDGFSVWTKIGRPVIVVGCRPVSASHRRFDIAHELGHLILHRHVDRRFLEQNPSTHGLIEEQAFRFARAFLMPKETFKRSIGTVSLDTLLMAKTHWYLSVATMMVRAKDLGMIDEETYKRFWANRNRRGWRTSEPLDDQIPFEQPRLLSSGMRALRDADADNVLAICDEIAMHVDDVARYCGIDPNQLQASPGLPELPTLRDQPLRESRAR